MDFGAKRIDTDGLRTSLRISGWRSPIQISVTFLISTIIQDFHFWVDLDAGREYSCLLYGRRTSGGSQREPRFGEAPFFFYWEI